MGYDPLGRDPFPAINTEYVNNGDRDHRIMEAMDKRNANEKQIGGKHYQSRYQHWDFVRDFNLDYFEGNATKYLTRRKGERRQDLQKAMHYLEKRYEMALDKRRNLLSGEQQLNLESYVLANNMTYREYLALLAICKEDYPVAMDHLRFLIDMQPEYKVVQSTIRSGVGGAGGFLHPTDAVVGAPYDPPPM